jgi:mannosyl-glycoprotein endo-beta-N-acetylglucosaminidase
VPYWHPGPTELPPGGRSILDWSPEEDADAPFNRCRVPLRWRERTAALKANPLARAGEARVMSCAEFWGTGKNPAQGVPDHRYYAFGHWQYVDVLVFWAGSAGEGLICPPNGHVADAAHRNGVKVYGSVFFPRTGDGGKKVWVEDFARKETTHHGQVVHPVADKLIEAAEYYGFDGWFINYETPTGDAKPDADVRDMLADVRSRSSVESTWYQAYEYELSDGSGGNAQYLQHHGRRVCESIFIDYGWDDEKITNSVATAGKIGRDKHDVHYGLELVRDADRRTRADLVCPAGGEHRGSLALYAAHMVSNQPGPVTDTWLERFHGDEAALWGGPCQDPSQGG